MSKCGHLLFVDSFYSLVQNLAEVQAEVSPVMTGFLMADWSSAFCECSISAPAVLSLIQTEQVKPNSGADTDVTEEAEGY